MPPGSTTTVAFEKAVVSGMSVEPSDAVIAPVIVLFANTVPKATRPPPTTVMPKSVRSDSGSARIGLLMYVQ